MPRLFAWLVCSAGSLLAVACEDPSSRSASSAEASGPSATSGAASSESAGAAGAPTETTNVSATSDGSASGGVEGSGASGGSGGSLFASNVGPASTGGGSGGEYAGGGAAGAADAALEFVDGPTLGGNPSPSVPQAAVLRLATNVPAELEVTVKGGGEEWVVRLAESTRFAHPIVGVKPDTAYEVVVRAIAHDAVLVAGPVEWASPPLPDDFPFIQLARSDPSRMEPGMTLFNVNVYGERGVHPLVIVDHTGVVRWYYLDANYPVLEGPRRLANGHFLFIRARCSVLEVDILGNVVGGWHAAEYPKTCDVPGSSLPVGVQSMHHDVDQLESGNFLALATEPRTVEGYPTSEDDPDAARETALVLGGVIVEFTPAGEILKEIPLLDLLDPTRIGRNSLSTSWPSNYLAEGEGAYDWDHANALVYEGSSDAYYVSLRHQDAVIKVSRSTEELVWILGTPANWREPWQSKLLAPLGELEWPFHQHAVTLTPHGLGLYDNGNNRAPAFETPGDDFSRAVLYEVDEAARTVEQVWSFGEPSGDDFFYSDSRGNADWQRVTNNVLVVSGAVQSVHGARHAQILEVTPDGERVFELHVGDRSSDPFDTRSHAVYRAHRLADIRY